ncbi:MAG: hypothetical protein NZM16_13310, partial [Thermoflexus sp.]|uniref:hypothetical protein n=1 Tax=Thermoflexus sp. TaxID=1969742 RepID=UPI0025D941F8
MARWWTFWSWRFAEGLRCHGPPVALFVALSLALTWPVARTAASHLENTGDAVLNAWTLGWDARHLLRPDQLPHAPNFYPYPYTLYFSEHLLGAALLATPVIGLTGNPILAYNVLFISSFALSALATYALVLWLTGDRSAATLSGLLFASMTLRFGPSPQLQVLLNFGIPLAILFLLRLFRTARTRDAVGLALAFTGQFLVSIYHGLFLIVGLIAVGIEQVLRQSAARRIAFWRMAILSGILAAGILLPVTWPYLEARRWVGTRGLDQQGSFGLLSFLLVPHGHLYAGLPPFWNIHRYDHVETLFPGMVTLALAAYGLWLSRSPWRRPFTLLVVLGTVFAIGPVLRLRLEDPPLLPAMPYILLWHLFPGFQAIRVPARMFVLAQLGLAVLAGLGWHAWRSRLEWHRWALSGIMALAVLEAYRGPFPRFPAPQPIPELDRLLAEMPGMQPFVEFPTIRTLNILSEPETMRRLSHAQFTTLYRKQPTPIGYSGFFPPLFWEVADRLLFFPSRESLAFFEDLGVKAILVRAEGWAPEEQAAFEARWALFQDRFWKVAETPAGALYLIKEHPRSGAAQVGIRAVLQGDRVWLFLALPRDAWPWRVSITPGRYTLLVMNPAAPEAEALPLQGALPLAMPAYLEALPVGWIPRPLGASVLKIEGRVEPGESGRMRLPPPRELSFQSEIPLDPLSSSSPVPFRMPLVEFGNGVALVAIALSGVAFCPGETLEFSMFWGVQDAQAFQAQDSTPVVFVHVHDREGRMVAGRDLPIDFGNRSFREWKSGEVFVQSYRIPLPADLPPGPASIVTGLYPIGRPEPPARWAIRSSQAPLWEHAAATPAVV